MSNAKMDLAETKSIQIVLNGAEKRVPAGFAIPQLLEWLNIDPSRVAIELNRAIVRKPEWAASEVCEGAEVEIVWFVGGG